MPEGRVTSRQKKIVAERAQGCCEYCRSQARFAIQPFSVEHIIPRSMGGTSTDDNLALSCQGCNNHKYVKTEAMDLVSGEIASLYHPRKNRWSAHFAWNEDFSLIVGLTPSGRATVDALRLNREGLVNLRRILFEMGEHPPAEPIK